MIATPYWINSQLAIVPRPRGGDWLEDELAALREAGIDILVSMLQEDEAAELGLYAEGDAAQRSGVAFFNFPIPDRGVPLNSSLFALFLADLTRLLASGKRIGVHCRACIGRASILSASLLIRSGTAPEDAWRLIATSRGCSVPDTVEQRAWVDRNISVHA